MTGGGGKLKFGTLLFAFEVDASSPCFPKVLLGANAKTKPSTTKSTPHPLPTPTMIFFFNDHSAKGSLNRLGKLTEMLVLDGDSILAPSLSFRVLDMMRNDEKVIC